MRRTFIAIILALTVLAACSKKPAEAPSSESGAPAATNAPAAAAALISITISPESPASDTTIELAAQGITPAPAMVSWAINGKPVSTKDALTFTPLTDDAKKGDKISALLRVSGNEYRSNEVVVKNTPPKLTKVKLMPETLKHGEDFWVDAEASDIDSDPVTVEYEWKVGDKVVSTTKSLPRELMKRGTDFVVTVTPNDGEAKGEPVIIKRSLTNVPPMIDFKLDYKFEDEVLTYQIRATDPDGDPLTYGVKTPEPGLSVDADTGLLKWDVPESLINTTVPIVVTADDGRGGTAQMELKVTFKTETVILQPGQKAPAKRKAAAPKPAN